MTSGQLAFQPKGAVFKAHTPKAKTETMVALDGEPARQSSLVNFGATHSNSNIISTKAMTGQTVQNFTLAPSVGKRNLSVSGIQVLNEMQDMQFITGRSVDDGRLQAQKQYVMVSPKIAVPSSAGIKILNNNPVPIASKPPTPASMASKLPTSVAMASPPNLLEQASQFAANNKSPICNSFGTVILPSSAANAALKSIGMASMPGNFSIVAACSRALEQQGSSVVFSSASDFQNMFPSYMANIVLKSTTPRVARCQLATRFIWHRYKWSRLLKATSWSAWSHLQSSPPLRRSFSTSCRPSSRPPTPPKSSRCLLLSPEPTQILLTDFSRLTKIRLAPAALPASVAQPGL